MEIIDLRSDTVTHPTPEMRLAMADAPVGDDVYGEDPTVNELERLACRMTGKEAAVFVASGTMGNVAAILAHTHPGDELICGYRTHIYRKEQGAMAALGGVQAHPVMEAADGTLPLEEIEKSIQSDDEHHSITRMITIENTQNMCGGQPLTPEYTQDVGALASRYNLRLHVDGARLFNAAVALGVSVEVLVGAADSVTFCLSKGLCAPVGSVLCGNAEFIRLARRARKVLGGSMRQAGVLAAPGIVALNSMIERLEDDHANARQFASGLACIEGVQLAVDAVSTNMVYFGLDQAVPLGAAEVIALMAEHSVLIDQVSERSFRVVTHHGISVEMVEQALQTLTDVVGGM